METKTNTETITFVCIESHSEEHYEEEFGREQCFINTTSKVAFHEVPFDNAKEFYDSYLDRNADNPPYDAYKIKLAYHTETKEVISLQYYRDE